MLAIADKCMPGIELLFSLSCMLLISPHHTEVVQDAHGHVIYPEHDCERPSTVRKYAVVCYAMNGFRDEYMERVLRPWMRLIRVVEPDLHIVIASPRVLTSPELVRFVNLTNALYGHIYLAVPPKLGRSDISPQVLQGIDRHAGSRDKFGWKELWITSIWNLDDYDALVLLEPDVWLLRPLQSLFWCSEEYDFLSTVGHTEPLWAGMLMLRPSKLTYSRMKTTLLQAHLDECGGWDGTGVHPNRINLGACWAWGTQQTFLNYFFHVARYGYRTARLDVCIYGGLTDARMKHVHPRYSLLCQLELMERNYVALHLPGARGGWHSPAFHSYSSDVVSIVAQRLFVSPEYCWDNFQRDKNGNAVFLQDKALPTGMWGSWSELQWPTLTTFASCCDLRLDPRVCFPHDDTWPSFTQCCLLQP